MPIITPDLSEVTSGKIEPGNYEAKIVSVELKDSSKGNPMIVPTFDINVGGVSQKRKAYHVVSGRGAYGFENLLRATGFSEIADKLKAGEAAPFDTDELLGQQVNVVIGSELYNGQARDKIDSYLPF